MKPTLLVVEDDADIASTLRELAVGAGFSVRIAPDGEMAERELLSTQPDVMLTDLRVPPPDGLALLGLARELDPDMPVVMITGFATADNAIEAFRLGVFDVITKPFDVSRMRVLLKRLFAHLEHRWRIEGLSTRLRQLDPEPESTPVVFSQSMAQAIALLHQAVDTDILVLLNGETGTGKSLLGRLLHAWSPRRDGPFLSLNCAGIPSTLAESELFGHEEGAFTGARKRKRGLLELADGGTLLLDEINSAAPEIQVRLLHFLQERVVRRVGGDRSVPVDVRIVCASNEPLERLVEQGAFRADLYYRLNVFPVEVPALRRRPEDVIPLAEQFLAEYGRRYGRRLPGFTLEALDALGAYDWPGNVRELENAVQRAVVLAPQHGEVGLEHLPSELGRRQPLIAGPMTGMNPDASLEMVEEVWIRHMLMRCAGNKREAARRLGINVSTLHRRLGQMR